MKYTAIFHGYKNDNFQLNIFDYFHIFAQNINLQCIENEFHFLSRCPLYDTERTVLYSQINHVSNNFNSLNYLDKAKWLLMKEDQNILVALGTYIHICFEKRKKNVKLISV